MAQKIAIKCNSLETVIELVGQFYNMYAFEFRDSSVVEKILRQSWQRNDNSEEFQLANIVLMVLNGRPFKQSEGNVLLAKFLCGFLCNHAFVVNVPEKDKFDLFNNSEFIFSTPDKAATMLFGREITSSYLGCVSLKLIKVA